MRSQVRFLLDPQAETWGISSIGRASALQAEGQEFDSPMLHSAHLPPVVMTGGFALWVKRQKRDRDRVK